MDIVNKARNLWKDKKKALWELAEAKAKSSEYIKENKIPDGHYAFEAKIPWKIEQSIIEGQNNKEAPSWVSLAYFEKEVAELWGMTDDEIALYRNLNDDSDKTTFLRAITEVSSLKNSLVDKLTKEDLNMIRNMHPVSAAKFLKQMMPNPDRV